MTGLEAPGSLAVDPLVGWVCRGVLAAVLGAAAVHKLRDLPRFAAVLGAYRLLPEALARPAALALAATEGAVALGLLLPLAGLVPAADPAGLAATGAALLFGLYALAIAINLARGRREIDCGCSFGRSEQPLSAWLLLRNGLLIAAAAAAVAPRAPRELALFDAAVGGLAVLAWLLVYHAAHVLLANRAALRAGA